ncbi:MAG: hypothetical protein SFU87_05110 [Chitinophagaceae bacterium]|nr:hypothetical protein [Chitinophagaceae bacterium]
MFTTRFLLLCTASFLVFHTQLFAQAAKPADSATMIKDLSESLKKVNEQNKKLQAKADSLEKPVPPQDCTVKQLKPSQTILVFTPLVLLAVFTVIFIVWISKSNFSLEDALSVAPSAAQIAEVAKMQAQVNLAAQQAGNPPPTIPPPQPQRSVSRLLAFITGVIALVIAVCLVSYHGYAMFAGCGGEKQFDALWKVLLGLGIGVIPYGINVWNGNPKEQTTAKP